MPRGDWTANERGLMTTATMPGKSGGLPLLRTQGGLTWAVSLSAWPAPYPAPYAWNYSSTFLLELDSPICRHIGAFFFFLATLALTSWHAEKSFRDVFFSGLLPSVARTGRHAHAGPSGATRDILCVSCTRDGGGGKKIRRAVWWRLSLAAGGAVCRCPWGIPPAPLSRVAVFIPTCMRTPYRRNASRSIRPGRITAALCLHGSDVPGVQLPAEPAPVLPIYAAGNPVRPPFRARRGLLNAHTTEHRHAYKAAEAARQAGWPAG